MRSVFMRNHGVLAVAFGLACATLEILNAAESPVVDPTFDPGAGVTFTNGSPGSVRAMAVQPDGKVIIGGAFDLAGGQTNRAVARLNADGSLDTVTPLQITVTNSENFPFVNQAAVNTVVVQTNGQILVGGTVLARLNADGTPDPGFSPPALIGFVTALNIARIVVLPDQQIMVAGSFGCLTNDSIGSIVRLTPAGNLDPAFVGNARFYRGGMTAAPMPADLSFLAVQLDGKCLVAGPYFDTMEGKNYNGVWKGFGRATVDGLNDLGFSPLRFSGGAEGVPPGPYTIWSEASVTCLEAQPDGNILAGRLRSAFPGAGGPDVPVSLQRLTPSGALDSAFRPVILDQPANAVVVRNDSSILIGGAFTNVNGQSRGGLARLNPDGTLDAWTAGSGVSGGAVQCIVPLPDGKVCVGGDFTSIDGVVRHGIARLNLPPILRLLSPVAQPGMFSASVVTTGGKSYVLQSVDVIAGTNWTIQASVAGDGAVKTLIDTNAPVGGRFYRVAEASSQ